MNYDGAEDLEFGGGKILVDPAVAASPFMIHPKQTYELLITFSRLAKRISSSVYRAPWHQFLGCYWTD